MDNEFGLQDGRPFIPQEVPILGKLSFDAIQWELGRIAVVEEDGTVTVTGIIFRFCFPALPWFKFQIPFARLEARGLIRAMEEKLDEEAPTVETET
jgi:hypothetical protein